MRSGAETPAALDPASYTVFDREPEDEPPDGPRPMLPLLRYPRGEGPLDRGLNGAER
jgi:hypothetical protein